VIGTLAAAQSAEAARARRTDRLLLAGALLLSCALIAGGFWRWPWDHDEVLSLAEAGVLDPTRFPGPVGQIQRIRIILPVWYYAQHAALSVLPANEFGARVLPVLAALLLVAISALWAGRRSVRFATGLVLLAGASPMVIWLAQQNRFYSLALCLLAASLLTAATERRGVRIDVLAMLLAVGAVLTHNLTLVSVVVAFVAAVIAHWWGPPRRALVRRTALMAAGAVAIYVVYLRPALQGWVSGGTGGTSPFVSYVAQLGLVPAGLALLGVVGAVLGQEQREQSRWWLFMAAGSVLFVSLAPWLMRAWNPRYALFFMWPVWLLAASGFRLVADRLESGMLRAGWALTVLLMIAPKLLSHLADGTRHDFRSAAHIVAGQHGQTVISNWPATLQYYLERENHQRVEDWQPGARLPDGQVILAFASNAWSPVLSFADRSTQVVGEVRTRRFDEQSHVIRVYRVEPAAHNPAGLAR
jgi:hypothetical protein